MSDPTPSQSAAEVNPITLDPKPARPPGPGAPFGRNEKGHILPDPSKPPPADRGPKRPYIKKADRRPTGPGTGHRVQRSIAPELATLFTTIGLFVSPFDPICGGAVIENAPNVARSLNNLANTNPKIRKALQSSISGGAWGGVVLAIAPILITVGAHHGFIPAQFAALVPDAGLHSDNGQTASPSVEGVSKFVEVGSG